MYIYKIINEEEKCNLMREDNQSLTNINSQKLQLQISNYTNESRCSTLSSFVPQSGLTFD